MICLFTTVTSNIYLTCMINYSGNVKTGMSFTLNISTSFQKYNTIQNPSTIEEHIYFHWLNGEEFQSRRFWDLRNRKMADKCYIHWDKGGAWVVNYPTQPTCLAHLDLCICQLSRRWQPSLALSKMFEQFLRP